MICIKIHRSYRDVVAVCDKELVGKKFKEGKRQLDIRESFYSDKVLSPEEAIQLIQLQSKEDATFNIVGPKSIEVAKQAEIITNEGVKNVQGVPFALVLN